MAKNLTQTVLEFLRKRPERRFTVTHVAKRMANSPLKIIPNALRKSFEEERKLIKANEQEEISKGLFYALRRQVSALLSWQVKKGNLQRVEGEGLLKYYSPDLNKVEDEKRIEDEENVVSAVSDENLEEHYTEKEMYPWLCLYLKGENIGSKEIDHTSNSGNSNAGEDHWLFPDVVGIEILIENWEEIVAKSLEGGIESQFKFWSFEVKKEVSKSDVRKKFFQAVANSSWANFGYLVVGKLDGAEEELKILSNHFGIGVIKINSQKNQGGESEEESTDAVESLGYIKFPARENKNIDWAMINRLAKKSVDFNNCLSAINNFNEQRKLPKENFKKLIEKSLPELKTFWGLDEE